MMMKWILLLSLLATTSIAQELPSEVDALQERVDVLERQIAMMETDKVILHTFTRGRPCLFCDRWKAVELPKLIQAGICVIEVPDIESDVAPQIELIPAHPASTRWKGYQPTTKIQGFFQTQNSTRKERSKIFAPMVD
jgi:hypothetical protein